MPILFGVLRLVWEASPPAVWLVFVLALATASLPPVIVWLGKHLVDLAVGQGGRTGVSFASVVPTVLALGAATALARALGAVQANRQVLFATAVELHAERRVLERIASTDLADFDRPEWYDRAARATSDLSGRPYNLAVSAISLVGSIVTLGGMFVLLSTVSPLLGLLAVVAVIPSAYAQRYVSTRLYNFWVSTTGLDRRREYLRDLLSRPATAKEIRAYGLRDHLLDRHKMLSTSRLASMRRVHARGELVVLLGAVLTGAGLAAAYGLVASRAVNGHLTAGDLTLVIGAFAAAHAQMGSFLGAALELDRSAAFLEDYFALLASVPQMPVRPDPVALPADLAGGIAFRGVTFTYPGREEPSLSEVNLEIAPGQLVALVGENGAGKTTLVKLLLRLYDPDEGSVSVGGVDLRDADLADLRRRIGVLFQDYPHYELTVRENVAMGRAERAAGEQDLARAMQVAGADTLGLHLETPVGKLFEGSHDLSGGEWQRLALARLVFRDADIWVLDEPTAVLDAEAEARLFDGLRSLLRNRMGILISHRFSTVRIADRIVVLAGGRVIEQGTHDELVAAGGAYAHLFELQATGYR